MDCVHNIFCGSCEKTYIVETRRKFGTALKEHKTEVEATTNKLFTRSQHLSSLSEQNKSALTDHASHDNHVINWLFRPGVWQKYQMDQGSSTHPEVGTAFCELERGQLHTEPRISCHAASLPWQEPEEELSKLFPTKVSHRDRNVKGKMFCLRLI